MEQAEDGAIHIWGLLTAVGLPPIWVRSATGMSAWRYRELRRGLTLWRVEEVEAVLNALQALGRRLSALTWGDLVESGADLIPRGRQRRPGFRRRQDDPDA